MSRRTPPFLITAATRYDPALLSLKQTLKNSTVKGTVQQNVDWALSYDGHTDFRGLFALNSMGRYTREGAVPDMSQLPQITSQPPGPDHEAMEEWQRLAATYAFFDAMFTDIEQRWRDTPAWYAGHGPERFGAMPPKVSSEMVDGRWEQRMTDPADLFKVPRDPPTMDEENPELVKWPGKLRLKVWRKLDELRRITHAVDGAPMTVRELEELAWVYRVIERQGEEPSVRTLRNCGYHVRTTPLERRTGGLKLEGEATWIPPPLAEATVWPTFWYSTNPNGVLGAGLNLLTMAMSVFVSQERAALAPPPTAGLWAKDEYDEASRPPDGAADWYADWWRARYERGHDRPTDAAEPPAKRARTSSEEAE